MQPESTIAEKSKAVIHSLIIIGPYPDINGNFANMRFTVAVTNWVYRK
jgi:uncharacterized membrane protein